MSIQPPMECVRGAQGLVMPWYSKEVVRGIMVHLHDCGPQNRSLIRLFVGALVPACRMDAWKSSFAMSSGAASRRGKHLGGLGDEGLQHARTSTVHDVTGRIARSQDASMRDLGPQ